MKSRLLKIFTEKTGDSAVPLIVRSPGRVNIIGEHTDYNEGFVLPAAIDKAAYIAITPRTDQEIHLFAADLHESFSIATTEIKPIGDISWPNYILGVVAQFKKRGIDVNGFNAVLMSDVPMGAGLSSSAAIECATVFALNELLQTHLDRMEMIQMAQQAEHEYAGVLCGIMDQFASMMGKKGHAIKLDCRNLKYDYVPLQLDGTKIVLLNTNVRHSLASSEYNTRRKECNQAVDLIGAAITGIRSLRDVTEAMIDEYVMPVDKLAAKRSRFVVQEIDRLKAACKDLEAGNLSLLGQKMFATHDGLSQMYEVSCPELDYLVARVRNNPSVIGARMMGGGFGGCTINLVRENAVEELIASVKPAYEATMGLPLDYYVAGIEDGTCII